VARRLARSVSAVDRRGEDEHRPFRTAPARRPWRNGWRARCRPFRLSPDEWFVDLDVDLFDELVRRLDARDSPVRIPRESLAEYEQAFEAPDDEELALCDDLAE
jgi:hypothetical protein